MPRWRCIDGEVWNVENEPESASGRQRGIKMNVPKRLAIYESPIRSLLLIAATLFVTHTLAMVMFSLLPQLSMWAESLTQSILLLALLFPVLYFVSLRPLLLHIAERQRAEEIMRESEQKYRNLFEHLTDAAFLAWRMSETEIFRKDGTGVPVRIGAVPTILHGRRLILQFMRDMTAKGIHQQATGGRKGG